MVTEVTVQEAAYLPLPRPPGLLGRREVFTMCKTLKFRGRVPQSRAPSVWWGLCLAGAGSLSWKRGTGELGPRLLRRGLCLAGAGVSGAEGTLRLVYKR